MTGTLRRRTALEREIVATAPMLIVVAKISTSGKDPASARLLQTRPNLSKFRVKTMDSLRSSSMSLTMALRISTNSAMTTAVTGHPLSRAKEGLILSIRKTSMEACHPMQCLRSSTMTTKRASRTTTTSKGGRICRST